MVSIVMWSVSWRAGPRSAVASCPGAGGQYRDMAGAAGYCDAAGVATCWVSWRNSWRHSATSSRHDTADTAACQACWLSRHSGCHDMPPLLGVAATWWVAHSLAAIAMGWLSRHGGYRNMAVSWHGGYHSMAGGV